MKKLIGEVVTQGMAEIITSYALTNAACADVFVLDVQAYGVADRDDDVLYVFNEQLGQYQRYKPLSEANKNIDYVVIDELKAELMGEFA